MHKRKIWLSSGLLIAALAMSLGHANTVEAASDQKTITIVDKKSGTTVEIDSSDKLFYNSNQMKRGFYEDKDSDNRQVYQWDITPPTISIDSKDVGSGTKESPYLVLDKSQVITGKVTDDGSGVASLILITPSGEITVPVKNDGTFSINVNLLTGTTTEFVLKATDNAGNMSAPSSVFFGTDEKAPVLTVAINSTESTPKETNLAKNVIKGTVSDNESDIESLIITDPDGTTYNATIKDNTYEVEVPTFLNKTSKYTITATDKVGNVSEKEVFIKRTNLTVTAPGGYTEYTGNPVSPGTVKVNTKVGYTIYYGLNKNSCTNTKKPEFTNAGDYTVYYKVVTDEGIEKTGSYLSTITKAKSKIRVVSNRNTHPSEGSHLGGHLKLGEDQVFYIETNVEDPEFEIICTGDDVVDYTLEGDTLTIHPKKMSEYHIDENGDIVFDSAEYFEIGIKESANFEKLKNPADMFFQVEPGTIKYTATGYGGSYDGAAHTGTVNITTPGCVIKYGTTPGSYTLNTPPTFTTAGTHNVYYKITKDNYMPVESSFMVVLRKVSAMTISTGKKGPNVKSGDIRTTYSDNGYETHLAVGSSSADMGTAAQTTVDGVTFTRNVYTNDIGQVVFEYKAKNTSTAAKTIGIAVHADIQVGTNDSAPITPTSTGFSMSDGSKATFNVYTSGPDIVTPADGVWFGRYSERTSHYTFGGKSSALKGIDSGVTINWHSRTIPAGATQTYNFIMDMQ